MEGIVASLEGLSREELAARLAKEYSEAVVRDQERRRAPLPPVPSPQGPQLRMAPPPAGPSPIAPPASAEQGWSAVGEIFGPLRDSVCEDYRAHPEAYRSPLPAVRRLLRLLTTVQPPPDFLVTASYLVYRRGLDLFCSGRGLGGPP